MDTEELYKDMINGLNFDSLTAVTLSAVKEQRRKFATIMIENNDIPDSCHYCLFRTIWSPSNVKREIVYCLIKSEFALIASEFRCKITDFIRYLLGNI